MESKLLDTIKYICLQLNSMEVDMLERMVYLADWVSYVNRSKPLTECSWFLTSDGPASDEFRALVQRDDIPSVRVDTVADGVRFARLGGRAKILGISYDLDKSETDIVDIVISGAREQAPINFLQAVLSTFIFSNQSEGWTEMEKSEKRPLDLKVLAETFHRMYAELKTASEKELVAG